MSLVYKTIYNKRKKEVKAYLKSMLDFVNNDFELAANSVAMRVRWYPDYCDDDMKINEKLSNIILRWKDIKTIKPPKK